MLRPPKDALGPCIGVANGLILSAILWGLLIYFCW